MSPGICDKLKNSMTKTGTRIKWPDSGIIPAVVQDYFSGRVLMMAYVNRESFEFMCEKGETCFWSRSRGELWHKGATSGDFQKIRHVALNCEYNSLLIQVEQMGKGACHTGTYTCYGDETGVFNVFEQCAEAIKDRAETPREKSYTNYLLDAGVDKICKKIGEESAEVIIAAKNGDSENIVAEIADLTYHMLVLMYERGVSLRDLAEELALRRAGRP
ncbi:MAG: bifunctional phosphoribosyl-AMP cyclohydrolase/phosphoribosyl-ATP diphosphatase HisIE [Defluviitaleaceae bacterium]|nr:bifunctional phosphoribosyl-AMP cyclohydrolase/phosphoribosyl-ATP diphosphatase HisIE [Defluviitaleaceae bacterium]